MSASLSTPPTSDVDPSDIDTEGEELNNLPVRLPERKDDKPKTSTDPSMIASHAAVKKAKEDNSGRVYRVYCDGVFDLFHIGHARMLEQAKKALGDVKKVYLLAGVCSDEDVHRYKGKTVMDHPLRCDSVGMCKWVDEVLPDAPWVIGPEYLKKYNIDFVAHDAIPYKDNSGVAEDSSDVYAYVKKQAMFLETQRTEGISTSDIIVKIIKDYDDYVVRNLDRGYTKKDLNVGKSWEMRAKFHEQNRRVKEQLNETRKSLRGTEDAALAFISEFNPKYLIRRNSVSGSKSLSPRQYMKRLKDNLPARRNELWHHTVGLVKALGQTGLYFASYFNPLSYCRKSKYQ